VAGIVAAVANNTGSVPWATNVAGVCWTAKIMCLNASTLYTLGYFDDEGNFVLVDYGYFFESADLAEAIRYAADNNADVINMSLGGSWASSVERDAIEYAIFRGVTVVAAAGNESTSRRSYPAAFDGVIAVAATDPNDVKADFSNWGSWVDVSAPGVSILSTMPQWWPISSGPGPDDPPNQPYASWDGTSMASPFVAGLSGLVVSYARSYPWPVEFSGAMVEQILEDSADDINSVNPAYSGMLGGRINAEQALVQTDEIASQGSNVLTRVSIKRDPNDAGPEDSVEEYQAARFQLIATFADGRQEDVADQAEWLCRPTRYGKFDPNEPGRLLTYPVGDSAKELTIYARYDYQGTVTVSHDILTVTQSATPPEPISITGPDSVVENASAQYHAVFTLPGGEAEDVTASSSTLWEVTSGASYVRLDQGTAGKVWGLDVDSAQQATLKVTYRDPVNRLAFSATKQITVEPAAGNVSGLSITGPQEVLSGTTAQFNARMIYADGTDADVTAEVTWTVDRQEAQFIEPAGTLQVGQVTETIDAVVQASYTLAGKQYSADMGVQLLPAEVAGDFEDFIEDVQDEWDDLFNNDDDQDNPAVEITCGYPAMAIFALLGLGFVSLGATTHRRR